MTFIKGQIPWNKGKTWKKVTLHKVKKNCESCFCVMYVFPHLELKKRFCSKKCWSIWNSIRQKGEKHWRWNGGQKRYRHTSNTLEYKKWRSGIFERDNWTCQTCGLRGVYLEAHHIKGWAKYPELRFDLNNGVALCRECHKLTDNYKGKK